MRGVLESLPLAIQANADTSVKHCRADLSVGLSRTYVSDDIV